MTRFVRCGMTSKNHLLCILSMAEERDVEGIEQYTRQLLQQQNTVNKLIMFSGSKVLDAIINSKSAAAERAGVRLSAIITTPLAGVSPEDITIILGNALDNAIESTDKITDPERRLIHLSVARQKGFAAIRIENCFDGELKFEKGLPVTTKKGCLVPWLRCKKHTKRRRKIRRYRDNYDPRGLV